MASPLTECLLQTLWTANGGIPQSFGGKYPEDSALVLESQ
jgi:hypothetical protein